MKKEGFTIIEVTVSVMIMTMVMVFFITMLNELKAKEISVDMELELLLNQATVSKNINEDIMNAGGIETASCSGTSCYIILNDGQNRTLELTNSNQNIKYSSTESVILNKTIPYSNYYNITLESIDLVNGELITITVGVNGYTQFSIEINDYINTI